MRNMLGRMHHEPASMQSAAAATDVLQGELIRLEANSWKVDESKSVLAPASSCAAFRINFQTVEEQESFMLRMAERTNSGSEPSMVSDAPESRTPKPRFGQPSTFGMAPISCSNPTRYASSGEMRSSDSATSCAYWATRRE